MEGGTGYNIHASERERDHFPQHAHSIVANVIQILLIYTS